MLPPPARGVLPPLPASPKRPGDHPWSCSTSAVPTSTRPPSATSEGAINRQDGTRPGGAFRHDRRSEQCHNLAIRIFLARPLPASFWRLQELLQSGRGGTSVSDDYGRH